MLLEINSRYLVLDYRKPNSSPVDIVVTEKSVEFLRIRFPNGHVEWVPNRFFDESNNPVFKVLEKLGTIQLNSLDTSSTTNVLLG